MVNFWFGSKLLSSTPFTFSVTFVPIQFSFGSTAPAQRLASRILKRRRPLWDVDGRTPCHGKKKRRLRLNLITSRLSRPFSSPASNIVVRGSSKIATWGRRRGVDKNVMRRAAIMNNLRCGLSAAKAAAMTGPETARHGIALKELPVQQLRIPRELPPSPLGLSNYDALDLEDEIFDDEDGDGPRSVYSDFNIMTPYTPADDGSYDYLDELDGITVDVLDDCPPPPPDDRLTELLMEKERQKELCSVESYGPV